MHLAGSRLYLFAAVGILVLVLAAALSPLLPGLHTGAQPTITAPAGVGSYFSPTQTFPGPITPTAAAGQSYGPLDALMPTRLPVPPQLIPFPHVAMVSRGIQCLFCHPDAIRSPSAGIPSVYLCMGCHDVIGRDSPAIQQVRAFWEKQQSIPWVRLYRLPRFVQFSHRPHMAAGLNCEDCHGDVGNMEVTVTVPYYKQMGWCLNCHERQPDPLPLTECQICHY